MRTHWCLSRHGVTLAPSFALLLHLFRLRGQSRNAHFVSSVASCAPFPPFLRPPRKKSSLRDFNNAASPVWPPCAHFSSEWRLPEKRRGVVPPLLQGAVVGSASLLNTPRERSANFLVARATIIFSQIRDELNDARNGTAMQDERMEGLRCNRRSSPPVQACATAEEKDLSQRALASELDDEASRAITQPLESLAIDIQTFAFNARWRASSRSLVVAKFPVNHKVPLTLPRVPTSVSWQRTSSTFALVCRPCDDSF